MVARGALRRSVAGLLAGLAVAAGARVAAAQPAPPAVPAFEMLRYDEDWSALCDPAARGDPLDALKCIPLGARDGWTATLGGELRGRFEWTRHPGFGAQGRRDDGQWLYRAMLHADLHFGPRARAFVQGKAVFERGRADGPRGADEDQLDLHQAFADAVWPLAGGGPAARGLTLRLGRQELQYGSSRLVSVRESPNVRRSFDAARAIVETGPWRVDALVSKPVETDRGPFDDESEQASWFWGAYAVRALVGEDALDLYYLGLADRNAAFDRGEGDQVRHSLGARLSGARRGFDWDFEAVAQAGRFDGDPLLAWTFASDTGYTFAALPGRPRLGLKADVASGDRGGARLGTFDALFPRGSYFGEAALIGPQNLVDVHPALGVALRDDLDLGVDVAWFWRQRREDGVYNGAGALVRSAGDGGGARFVGTQLSTELEWRPGRRWTLALVYQRFWAGRFLAESGPARDLDFVAAWVQWRL